MPGASRYRDLPSFTTFHQVHYTGLSGQVRSDCKECNAYVTLTYLQVLGGRKELAHLLQGGHGNRFCGGGHPLVSWRQHALHQRTFALFVVARSGLSVRHSGQNELNEYGFELSQVVM